MNFLYANNNIKLNDHFKAMAKKEFGHLNDFENFNTKLLKNKKARKQFLEEESAQKIELETVDNIKIEGYFIDRGANKAILIGQGFPSCCTKLVPFLKLFPDYDLLIINYRWHNWQSSLNFSSDMLSNPIAKYIYEAKNDVIAAVKFLKNRNQYESITGIGLCYSGLIYVIAQAMVLSQENEELLFDKLIIDSSYFSTEEVVNSVIIDPKLCCENKYGGTPKVIQSILSAQPISKVIKVMGNMFTGDQFERLSIEWYLPMIARTPIMFIHGKNDLLVPYRHFETMYQAAYNTSCCALITEHEHTLNHIKAKEAYAYLAKMFIECSSIKNLAQCIESEFENKLH